MQLMSYRILEYWYRRKPLCLAFYGFRTSHLTEIIWTLFGMILRIKTYISYIDGDIAWSCQTVQRRFRLVSSSSLSSSRVPSSVKEPERSQRTKDRTPVYRSHSLALSYTDSSPVISTTWLLRPGRPTRSPGRHDWQKTEIWKHSRDRVSGPTHSWLREQT